MKYNKIIQKPHCCVGACIEMILNRHCINNTGQEDIAYQLGLVVPESDRHLFKKVRTEEKPSSGYGTQIQKEEYSINNYFRVNNIPLKEIYNFINNIDDVRDFLKLNSDEDILVCFHCGTLFDAPHANWGHMMLFDHIEDDHVMLLDTSVKRDYETFPLEKLVEAISIHGKENGAGFYLIKKK